MGKVQILNSLSITEELERIISTVPELQEGQAKAQKLVGLIYPRVYWRTENISINGRSISLEDGKMTIQSSYLATGLQDCQRVTVLAATIGSKLPEHSSRCLARGHLWEGTIADILGSQAVEALVEKFYRYLAQTYQAKGLYPTLRFSPGYGDWPLDGQKDIVKYLQTQPVISFNPSFLLEPVKSITALIGWSSIPQPTTYPQGKRGQGFCQGKGSCAHCQTWACKA